MIKETKFIYTKYGITSELFVGQKVECSYYGEWSHVADKYKRPLYQQIIDRPFKPVKLGVIIGDAGIHPYWLGDSRGERYLFVRFNEYLFDKAIPISCIEDAKKSAEKMLYILNQDAHRIGEKGYGITSYNSLLSQAKKAQEFGND